MWAAGWRWTTFNYFIHSLVQCDLRTPQGGFIIPIYFGLSASCYSQSSHQMPLHFPFNPSHLIFPVLSVYIPDCHGLQLLPATCISYLLLALMSVWSTLFHLQNVNEWTNNNVPIHKYLFIFWSLLYSLLLLLKHWIHLPVWPQTVIYIKLFKKFKEEMSLVKIWKLTVAQLCKIL